jgi:hypothetical protein
MASPIADFVVSLGPDGQIFSQGSVSDIVAKDRMLGIEDQEKTEKTEDAVDLTKRDGETEQSDGKLIVKEEIEEGHISWPACA